MGMTLIEKILSKHSKFESLNPGDIVDIEIDARVARDFGGANVIKNIRDNGLTIADPAKTFFTFDTNPTGSDQKYAVNQQVCRTFAREHGIRVFDIDNGIGTHTLMHEGLAYPGSTAVTTDSHANILGAVGAFGQGMGDKDIAAAWSNGSVWFKVPESVKLTIEGQRPRGLNAKDIVLNLLAEFGANTLLGYSVELYGSMVDQLTLDERITIASMGTEMGAIILLFPPNETIYAYSEERIGQKVERIAADESAVYAKTYTLDAGEFVQRVSRPGKPHDTVAVDDVMMTKIDSAFIGSCTNGRMEDLRIAAAILQTRQVAPGVVLKIVPATNEVWMQAMDEGLIRIFKNAGALVSNAGCAGCAAGQVGQNGPGEVTISTGNRNFPGKQGKGDVFLASPAVVAASAVAGYITSPDNIPAEPAIFQPHVADKPKTNSEEKTQKVPVDVPKVLEGRAWLIMEDNIDTDMIFHNRYLSITKLEEMGPYAFDNLQGYEDFAKKARPGDVVITGKNFGAGSSRQQAVDCFKALGVTAIVAESFGAIYERNAINAAFPILRYQDLKHLPLSHLDKVRIDLETGVLTHLKSGKTLQLEPFSEVQMEIYQRGGLF